MKANLKQSGYLLIVILCLALAAGCTAQKTTTGDAPAAPPAAQPAATGSEPAVSQPAAGAGAAAGYGAKGAAADKALTMEKMLVYAIQNEYLARGEYEHVLSKFGDVRPFNNIMEAEVQHIAELKILFDKYKMAVPADTSKDHIVTPATIEEALKVGVQAEIDNIAMYKSFLEKELPEDVRSTFNYLKSGSENHLDAFQRNLNR
jgi:hypothetical protein